MLVVRELSGTESMGLHIYLPVKMLLLLTADSLDSVQSTATLFELRDVWHHMPSCCEDRRASLKSLAVCELVCWPPLSLRFVLITTCSEKQIEQINDRLSGIEDALKHLRLDKSNLTPNTVVDLSPASGATGDTTQPHIATPAAFEGASSFTSQAIRASQAAEISLEKIRGSADVADALSLLRNLVKTPGPANIRQEFRLGFAGTPRQLPEIPLLPAQFVLSLLQEFKARHCSMFLACAFRDQRELERVCQRVYFPTEPVPLAVLTLMNGMLFYIMKEMMIDQSYGACGEYASEMKEFCNQVERNFHLGIETFDLLASPSLDSAKALMIAVSLTCG